MKRKKSFSKLSLAKLSAIVFTLSQPVFAMAAALPKLKTQATVVSGKAVTLSQYLNGIRDYLLGFSGALAVLFIVWGGLQYVASSGNEERAKKAKATLTYAIMGLILILLAQVILHLITGDLLGSIFTGGSPY